METTCQPPSRPRESFFLCGVIRKLLKAKAVWPKFGKSSLRVSGAKVAEKMLQPGLMGQNYFPAALDLCTYFHGGKKWPRTNFPNALNNKT